MTTNSSLLLEKHFPDSPTKIIPFYDRNEIADLYSLPKLEARIYENQRDTLVNIVFTADGEVRQIVENVSMDFAEDCIDFFWIGIETGYEIRDALINQ
ncbi:MAG: hypothetical protein PHX87_02570 [Candidatus Peribacteraceae bacterium]|nr:hypothetical protein [Candidatus Peribacteraceae bacterium]